MKVDPKCELENKKDPPDLLCEMVDLKSVSVDSKARNNQKRNNNGKNTEIYIDKWNGLW